MSGSLRPSSLRRPITVAALLSQLLPFSLGAAPLPAAERASASRPSSGPIRVIELRGTPATIGREFGRQLAGPIRLLHEQYIKRWFGDEQRYRQALHIASQFREFLPPDYREEVDALARAGGLTPDAVLLANSFLDFAAGSGCSTVALSAEAAPDGVPRFGRNLDFPSLDVADKHSIVLVVHPKDRHAFAAVTWPGMLGVLSGMNEHGLTLANMEVPRKQLPPRAMPYIYLYRTVLEQCRTVDEAIALLRKSPRQSANNLMLMDAAGRRAVVEISPERIVVRESPPRTALVSTNHQRDQNGGKPGLCGRYDRLYGESARQFGRIGVAAVQRMLDQTASEITLQSMVFEPTNRVIWLALGANAPAHGYTKVELSTYFP